MDGHTFGEFREMSNKMEKDDQGIDWTKDSDIFNKIETEYWNYVENQVGIDYRVEYAADLNANKFGNGFGMPD